MGLPSATPFELGLPGVPVLQPVNSSSKQLEYRPSPGRIATKKIVITSQVKPGEESQQMQLPFWPDEERGVPNIALRSALFSVAQTRKTATKRQLLETLNGQEIRFKGERFNQHDLDLWEMLLHFSRKTPPGEKVEFTANKLLKALGRGTGGTDHEELKEDIARLISGVVEITWTNTGKTFIGHLVDKAFRDENTQRYVVIFDEKILMLYDQGYTRVDWRQRQLLAGNSLAKWLHGSFASHAAPKQYKVATIKALCGSSFDRLTDFRKALRVALDRLVDVGALNTWEINSETDLVKVKRTPSTSQLRHLKKNAENKNSSTFNKKITN